MNNFSLTSRIIKQGNCPNFFCYLTNFTCSPHASLFEDLVLLKATGIRGSITVLAERSELLLRLKFEERLWSSKMLLSYLFIRVTLVSFGSSFFLVKNNDFPFIEFFLFWWTSGRNNNILFCRIICSETFFNKQMAPFVLQVIPCFHCEYWETNLFNPAKSYLKYNMKMCEIVPTTVKYPASYSFAKNHKLLRGIFDLLLQKLDQFCLTYQNVDSVLYTIQVWSQRKNCHEKWTAVWRCAGEVHFNQQNRRLDWKVSIARKIFLGKKEWNPMSTIQ